MTVTDDTPYTPDDECPHVWRWLDKMNGFVCLICGHLDAADGDGGAA